MQFPLCSEQFLGTLGMFMWQFLKTFFFFAACFLWQFLWHVFVTFSKHFGSFSNNCEFIFNAFSEQSQNIICAIPVSFFYKFLYVFITVFRSIWCSFNVFPRTFIAFESCFRKFSKGFGMLRSQSACLRCDFSAISMFFLGVFCNFFFFSLFSKSFQAAQLIFLSFWCIWKHFWSLLKVVAERFLNNFETFSEHFWSVFEWISNPFRCMCGSLSSSLLLFVVDFLGNFCLFRGSGVPVGNFRWFLK